MLFYFKIDTGESVPTIRTLSLTPFFTVVNYYF